MFAFSLDTEEKESKIITYIDEVKNLESTKTNLGYREIRLIGIENIDNFKTEIEKATKIYDNQGFFHLLDKDKSIVTSTFISGIKIIKSKKINITVSGTVWFHPKGFHKSWKMFLNNEITERNSWKKLDKDELQGWLVFALHRMKPQPAKENLILRLDGNDFNNLDEFFCSFGEEVNGIGGYFGRQLYALYDCLRGDFGVKTITEITWYNHERSKKLLRSNFDKILHIFQEYEIKIYLK
ncbi:barstar family protein [Chryseobacterium sp. C3]|uniref:barstar family protein n=1 Tax=Chryseobacterium sp. C3 TaxID=2761532 RepID=UPI0016249648|nr:barstar family protein [Chryseobacterium sp. C3]